MIVRLRIYTGDTPRRSSDLTLRQWIDRWTPTRRVSPSTARMPYEVARWWERLTDDPPLGAVTQETIDEFARRLAQATYNRTKHKLPGHERRLSSARVAKLLADLGQLCRRISSEMAGFPKGVEAVPLPDRSPARPRAAFSLTRARQIVAAADQMQWPPNPRAWWRVAIGLAFYCGLRSSDVARAQWCQAERRAWHDLRDWLGGHSSVSEAHWWLTIAEQQKTKKSSCYLLPPLLVSAMEELAGEPLFRAMRRPGRICEWPPQRSRRSVDPKRPYSPVLKHFKRLQTLAGIPAHEQLDWHAWRRTHAAVRALYGAEAATEAARMALQHCDASTTTRHYVAVDELVVLRFPSLW